MPMDDEAEKCPNCLSTDYERQSHSWRKCNRCGGRWRIPERDCPDCSPYRCRGDWLFLAEGPYAWVRYQALAEQKDAQIAQRDADAKNYQAEIEQLKQQAQTQEGGNMELLVASLGLGFAGGFTVAWLLAGGIKKEIATLSGKVDGFLAAMKKL